jgi:hypothetical protein
MSGADGFDSSAGFHSDDPAPDQQSSAGTSVVEGSFQLDNLAGDA